MSKPKDQALYDSVKARVYKQMPKHSAYRSGRLVSEYKKAYSNKHGDSSAYEGRKTSKKGLTRWFKEEWRNQRGGVGYKKKGDVYRPTKKVSSKTPKTYKELGKKRITKAMKEKKQKGRVKKF